MTHQEDLHWFYHSESQDYIRGNQNGYLSNNDAFVYLGVATTESESEAKALHQELIQTIYTR